MPSSIPHSLLPARSLNTLSPQFDSPFKMTHDGLQDSTLSWLSTPTPSARGDNSIILRNTCIEWRLTQQKPIKLLLVGNLQGLVRWRRRNSAGGLQLYARARNVHMAPSRHVRSCDDLSCMAVSQQCLAYRRVELNNSLVPRLQSAMLHSFSRLIGWL
jgi:hypothetical protein